MSGMFEGKVALVTGGASGIGRVGAQLFAREGAKVVVATGRNVAGGNETVKLIEDAGGEAIFVQCDVSKDDQVRALVEECVKAYGRLDYAFNNAGIGPDGVRVPLGSIVDLPVEVWDRTIGINLTGVFLCLRYEMKQMMKQGTGGAIVNTSSAAAVKPGQDFCAYNSSKAGQDNLTRSAALEGGQYGIRVNAIRPGPIQNTLLWQHLTSTTPEEAGRITDQLPLHRIGFPEDVAEAVIYLCSDTASFITGQCLGIDGGLTAGG
jgi:NAD(P)-dependent dehydrogenase (short-subunit alcohol dehydrogenase family)